MRNFEVARELRARGATRAVVSFSGGNDEGGADGIELELVAGGRVQLDPHGVHALHEYERGVYEDGTDVKPGTMVKEVRYDQENRRPVYRDATAEEVSDQRLAAALTAPVYATYGSFAGEFQVDGEVVWDATTGEHDMTGRQTVWQEL